MSLILFQNFDLLLGKDILGSDFSVLLFELFKKVIEGSDTLDLACIVGVRHASKSQLYKLTIKEMISRQRRLTRKRMCHFLTLHVTIIHVIVISM